MFNGFGILTNVSGLKYWNSWSPKKAETTTFLALFSVINISMIFIGTGIVSIILIIFKHLLKQPQNTKNAEDCIKKRDASN